MDTRVGTPATAPARPHSESLTRVDRLELRPSSPAQGLTRPFDATQRPSGAVQPVHRSPDHRYARPHHRHVRPHPQAHHRPPRYSYYRPHYARWWVHPYWRYRHATWGCVVSFHFGVSPWVVTWAPPPRHGWIWVSGWYVGGIWYPGYWRPVRAAPVYYSVQYVYVPGYWQGETYVEGWYRPEARDDGDWYWVEGYYLEDGTYIPGYWMPATAPPEGYTWEPGYFDGETWVEGFWRPEYNPGFVWISRYFDTDGVFIAGYWEPLEDQPGQVWIPGWFDGNTWVAGYWVSEAEYRGADPSGYQPAEGWDAGWEEAPGAELHAPVPGAEDSELKGPSVPLALPVDPLEADEASEGG